MIKWKGNCQVSHLDEKDRAKKVFCDFEPIEDPVDFPPPVVLCLQEEFMQSS